MSDDYVKATGRPGYVTIAGTEYRVPKLSPRMIGDLEAWLRKQVPDPRIRARLDMEGQPDAVRIHIWDQATAEAAYWPPTILNESSLLMFLKNFEGQCELLYHVLKKYTPGLTRDKVKDIAEEATFIDMSAILEAIMPEEFTVPPKDESSSLTAARPDSTTTADSTSANGSASE